MAFAAGAEPLVSAESRRSEPGRKKLADPGNMHLLKGMCSTAHRQFARAGFGHRPRRKFRSSKSVRYSRKPILRKRLQRSCSLFRSS